LVGRYLCGQVSEQELYAAAALSTKPKPGECRCEAHYYIGVRSLLNGDKEGAELHFRRCIETDVRNYNEYDLAKGELDRKGR
jgi:lipoprotein NlpI